MRNILINKPNIKINVASTQLNYNYYGKTIHIESTCYTENGFPKNHDNKGSKNPSRNFCTHYGHNGHTMDVCYRKHGFPPGHQLYGGKSNSIRDIEIKQDSKQDDTTGEQDMHLTYQRYQAWMTLLRSKESNNSDT